MDNNNTSQKSGSFLGGAMQKISHRAKNDTSNQRRKALVSQLATIAYQTANAPLLGRNVNRDFESSRGEISAIHHTAPDHTGPMNIRANSIQTESSTSTQSPDSLFEIAGSHTSGEESLASLSDKVTKISLNSPPELDLRAPIFTKLRDEPVHDLTCRIKDIPSRKFFEGTYSNVWMVTLEGGGLVRWFP
jgi:hypothetical protein